MCPDRESDPQSFGVWDDTPTNGATRPGLLKALFTVANQLSLWMYQLHKAGAHCSGIDSTAGPR